MVEGKGSDDYRLVKSLMYARPDLMHRILAVNADSVAAYLNAQIDAGAQAVMIFDTWGGVLADGAFQEFTPGLHASACWPSSSAPAVDGTDVPRIVFTKGGGIWLPDMQRTSTAKCWAWTGPPTWARPAPSWAAQSVAPARRCRATSTPTCCSPRPSRSPPRRVPCWTALAVRTPTPRRTVPPTSSTWGMGSANSPRRSMWPPWSRPCTATRARCARLRPPRRNTGAATHLQLVGF